MGFWLNLLVVVEEMVAFRFPMLMSAQHRPFSWVRMLPVEVMVGMAAMVPKRASVRIETLSKVKSPLTVSVLLLFWFSRSVELEDLEQRR